MGDLAHMLQLDAGTALLATLDDGTALIVASGGNVPDTIDVLPNGNRAQAVRAAALAWPLARAGGEARSAFAALFTLPPAERRALRSVTLRLHGRLVQFALRPAAGGMAAIFRAIVEDAGPATGTIVDGLAEMLLAPPISQSAAGHPARDRIAAASVLIGLAARTSGFIEVIGGPAPRDSAETYLQGWAADFSPGHIRVLVAGRTPVLAEFTCAAYDREDLGDRGQGFAGILAAPGFADAAALTHLYYRAEDGWRGLELYRQRTAIDARDVPGHLRGIIALMRGPADALARLERTAHRFDGRETVSELAEPVRLGIDLAVRAHGGGTLVSGWLLDPRRLVQSVILHVGGQATVISDHWTRSARADVAEAFAGNPLFHGLSTRGPSGFLAFAPRPADARPADAYLELDLGDAHPPSYYPLAVSELPARTALTRMLASIDPRSAVAVTAVDRQFGPMLRSVGEEAPTVAERIDFGFDDSAPVALIVGLDERTTDIACLLALLALDPATRSVPIALAGPAEAMNQVSGEIERLAGFYRLAVRLVLADGVEDVFDAIEAGVAATSAGTLALLSADVLPGTREWLAPLLAAHRRPGERVMVSPTILFEDRSVRWAGTWLDRDDGSPALVNRHLGFPQSAIAGRAPEEISTGTLECCVLSRAAFLAADGFSRGYLGGAAKNLDMALRIRLAGTAALWLPQVEMLAADDAPDLPAWQLARRIDRWSFDHRWSLAIANMTR